MKDVIKPETVSHPNMPKNDGSKIGVPQTRACVFHIAAPKSIERKAANMQRKSSHRRFSTDVAEESSAGLQVADAS